MMGYSEATLAIRLLAPRSPANQITHHFNDFVPLALLDKEISQMVTWRTSIL